MMFSDIFTGHVQDASTGLTYMGARYYDPRIGRFMGVDPVGFDEANPLTFNRYAYANNNPYKFVDPDGEAAVVAVIAAATAFIIGNNAVNAYNNNTSVFDTGLSANGLKAAGKSFTVDAAVAAMG